MYNQVSPQGSSTANPTNTAAFASPSSNAPSQQQNAPKSAVQQQKNPSKSGMMLPVVGIILALIVIAAAGYLYANGYILKAPTTSLTTSTVSGSSVSAINGCGRISGSGRYYIQSGFKTGITSGACINVTSSNVDIICNSGKITGSGPFEGIPPFTYAIEISNQNNVTVAGCNIRNFSYGVFALSSNNVSIKSSNISVNYMADIYLNNTHSSSVENNYLSRSSSYQGSLFLSNGTSGVVVYNNTVQYNQYYGINVNASNNTFTRNFVNGTEFSFRCSAPNGFVISSHASLNTCYNSTGCGFLECKGTNIPANLSRIVLSNSIESCGSIKSPGSYSLTNNLNMREYVNTSNPYSLAMPCLTVSSKNVMINCKGFGIYNSTIALSTSGQNLTFENCKIYNASQVGILLLNASQTHISNVTLRGSALGMSLYNTSISTFSNLTISGDIDGMLLTGSYSNVFQNINASHNEYGAYLEANSFSNSFNKGILQNNSKIDVYATPDSANAAYNLMQSTSCGSTNAYWAACSRFIATQLNYIPVSSCTLINSPGNYLLESSINGARGNCINIKSDNVKLNCNNHTVSAASSSEIAPGMAVTNSDNVTANSCNFVGFPTAVNVSNSLYVTLNSFNVQKSDFGIVLYKSGMSGIYNSIVNGTTNASILLYDSSSSSVLYDSSTYGLSHDVGVWLNGSKDNRIINNTGSRNYIGLLLSGKSLNNTIQNNTMQLSVKYDYSCISSAGVAAENGGINYGTKKAGCLWLAALAASSPLVQCASTQQPGLFLLSQDEKYGAGTICFSAFNNATTVNCAGHTVIATGGGTFASFLNAKDSIIENCVLKGFTDSIIATNTSLAAYNNTVFESSPGTTAINITDARLGATVQGNNVSALYRGIAIANMGAGRAGALKNNMVSNAGTAYYLSNVSDSPIMNNTAQSSTYNGIVLLNSIINSFQDNNFLSLANGLECSGTSEGALNNSDLGTNACTTQTNCFWIRSSLSKC